MILQLVNGLNSNDLRDFMHRASQLAFAQANWAGKQGVWVSGSKRDGQDAEGQRSKGRKRGRGFGGRV